MLILPVVYFQVKLDEPGPSHDQVSGVQGIKIISDNPGFFALHAILDALLLTCK